MSAQIALASTPPAAVPRAEPARPRRERPPQTLDVDEPFTVLVAPPELVTRVWIEDTWERHGHRRLWVVAAAGGDRAADALAFAAVGHAPALVRAEGGSDEARQAVIVTMLQLRAGDVLVVVAEDATAARAWVGQGTRWRASWEAPEGEPHLLASR